MNRNNYSTEYIEEILDKNKNLERDNEILSNNLKTCEENIKFYQDEYFNSRVELENLKIESQDKIKKIEKELEKFKKENEDPKLPFYKRVFKYFMP